MAIMTEPHQVFYFVISSILIDMMHKKNPKIIYAAPRAKGRQTTSPYNVPIGIYAIFPSSMLFADEKMLIFPDHKTHLCAEK
jgi:hypothetical protein